MEKHVDKKGAESPVIKWDLGRKLELQEAMIGYIHKYFLSKGFSPIASPKIVPFRDDEAGHLIKVQVPGKENESLFLSRCPQLYKEIAALNSDSGRVYELGPVFRGEPISNGRRANEFVGLDVEIKTNDIQQVTEVLTDFVLNLRKDENLVRKAKKFSEDLNFPDKVVTLKYNEATKMVSSEEMGTGEEKKLSDLIRSEHKNAWILLTDFPASDKRAFYQIKKGGLTDSFDLIGEWEICSGGLRRRDILDYMGLLRDLGWSTKEFEPYTQIVNENGNQNTGGFGIGVERLLGAITKIIRIEMLQPYPRTPDQKIIF